MGRTNPTFRDALGQYREDWEQYRRGLRAEHKPAFDALFADAEAHADAAGFMNAREPMHPVFVSMLLEQKIAIQALEERVTELEESTKDSSEENNFEEDSKNNSLERNFKEESDPAEDDD